jgi:hypothetical protein
MSGKESSDLEIRARSLGTQQRLPHILLLGDR